MNRLCYRLVFNQVRRLWMAVRENARSREPGNCAAGAKPVKLCGAAGHCKRRRLLPLALAVAAALPTCAQAGLFSSMLSRGLSAPGTAPSAASSPAVLPVRADPSAPANQQPTVLVAPNGVPLVNIQTPSAAGVSRNTYSDFNVGSDGLILNNSVGSTQTQLGGWVLGNPWLARGAARVILNEVNSSNPSLLYGPMEVAGQAASVIVANPSGITCNGCGFINTPRVTLTTGRAILDANDGSVRGYRVEQGQVLIEGQGMNNQQVSFTEILTRALKVNAGIWAQDVRVVAGAREVGSDDSGLQPGALLADKERPQVAIDLSSIGGVYASGIRMIGTQSGVGVSNAGKLYAGVEEVALTSDGRIVNSGAISGAGNVSLQAASLDNLQDGQIDAARLQVQVGDAVTNRGLIDGGDTQIRAGSLNNLGTGRIYGDRLAVAADAVNNLAENGSAPVIAARERLDLAARQIDNREHAQVLSLGDMAIGGTLDAQGHASGQAETLTNASATIQAGAELDIKAASIVNRNLHFSTTEVSLPVEQVTEYQGAGSPTRYRPGTPDVYVYNDESDHLHTPEGNFESWSAYSYTRSGTETRVASSDPAKIVSGGDMRIDAGSVLNDGSQIVAGGNLRVNAASLVNTEVTGERRITESGLVSNYWREHHKGRDSTGSNVIAYDPPERIEAISLSPTVFKQNGAQAPGGTPAENATLGELQQTPVNSALYRLQPDPGAHYLVETDPAFANRRQWLSSDYLLQGVSADPNATRKRLGDGYYEQRLVQEQVAQLTGRRFLDNYASDEEQFLALMDQGVTLPQLYVRLQPGDLQSGGALIAGDNVQMNLSGDLSNGGSIAGRKVLAITAENLRNIGGRIGADSVSLNARQDMDNIGGSIRAESALQAAAGRDLNVVSNTRTQSNAQGSVTNIERVAGLYVSGDSGKLAISAGRDLKLAAAAVVNAGDTTMLTAGRDIKLETVTESRSQNLSWDANNKRSDATQSEAGSLIQGKGDVTLQAGHDITARAAQVQSSGGALTLAAGNDVNIGAGQTRQQVDEAHEHKGTSGMLSSTAYKSRDVLDATTAQASNLSGKTVTVVAARNLDITGSNVVSDSGTLLAANGNVTLAAATDTRNESHFREEKTSGITSSGGVGISIGSQKQSLNSNTVSTTAAASTVGSVQGDVAIAAGQAYRQTGSDVLAPNGNIGIAAKEVRIDEARETSRSTEERKFEQSGITVAVSNPVITAIQTAEQMKQAAANTKETRMKALAAANVAMTSKTAIDAVTAGQGQTIDGKPNQVQTGDIAANGRPETRDATVVEKVGGINVSVSLGKSSSQSSAVLESDQGRASSVAAGKDVQIAASGDSANSNLLVQGSLVRAGGSAKLQADGDVQLLASRNSASQQTSSQDSSASIGMSFGSDGLMANASASAARGKGDGSDVGYTNSRVEAGQAVALKSGGDTVLRGAVVEAPQVSAEVGGNLQIESLQDRSHYNSSQQSLGGSISVGAGRVSGNLSASKSKINSDYAAVAEQSGIKAGDGSFDVGVKGAAVLTGGAVTSTQKAVDEGRNRYRADGGSTLTDIANNASYSASGSAINIGSGFDPKGKLAPTGTSAGIGRDSDQTSSVTRAAISGIAGNKDARTGDAPAALPKIFDAQRVQKEITAQVQITRTFGQEASKSVATYSQNRRNDLRTLQKQATTDADRKAIQEQIDQLNMEERVMNVLIGAVQGLGTTVAAKEALSTAADEMRQLMVEDSKKFKGVTDGKTVLSNMSGESAGVRGDGMKAGGTRVDLDLLCGQKNERCVTSSDGGLKLTEDGLVQFKPDAAGGKSLEEFLTQTPEGKKMAGLTGGIQGYKGTLFGIPYQAGSLADKLVESFSGTHDMVGGKLSGLYDDQGNATRGRGNLESKLQDAWSASGAIVVSSPFAMAEFLSPELWKAISILLGAAK